MSELRTWAQGWSAGLVAAALVVTAVAPGAGAWTPNAGEPPVANLDALQRAFERVVTQVSPSVVGIRVQRRHFATLPETLPGVDADLFEQRVIVNGSGTVVDADGLVLTNEHVVQGASDIEVMYYDGQKSTATVLASDSRSDLAILQVPRNDLPVVQFCDWDQVARGQWAIALGNPFGLGRDGHLSVSVGIVSNLGRQLPGLGEVDDRFYNDMLQTTAAINPGNSGGPLFNIEGELIAVVTAMHTRAPADEGVGFAIPMTPAKRRVVEALCRGDEVAYGYLGLTVRQPSEAEFELLDAANLTGVVVDRVEPDGPAARAGVAVGDIVLRFDIEPVQCPAHMAELVGSAVIGNHVQLEILRGGDARTIAVDVEQRDVSRVAWMRGEAVQWRGMRLTDLDADTRRLMRVSAAAQGVVVIDVLPGSRADDAGVRIGQVIEAVDGVEIASTRDFLAQVRGLERSVEISIRDRGARIILP